MPNLECRHDKGVQRQERSEEAKKDSAGIMKRRNVLAQARAEDVTTPQGHSPVVSAAAAVPGLSARAPTAMNQGLAGVETTTVDSTNSSDLLAAVAASTGTNGTTSEDASLVKKRRTKNFKWREDMAKKSRSGVGIVTPVAPLEPVTFANWDEFIRVWTDYMVQTKTLYRRRSSCSTASWNSKNRFKTLPVPDSFQYATMAYWCTHGCIQPSRGTGVRAHLHNRFTGCTARITADVVYEKTEENQVRWFIRVRNQISQHNHRISDEIFNCYSNNSSVPDEMLLGPGDDATPRQQDVQAYYSTAGDIEVAGVPSQGDTVAAAVAPVATASRTGAPFVSSSVLSKEVLADEQKISMAQSEIQPLLDELRRTPSRVIHKRLQDVSEFVLHLVSKWERDRTNEERHLHFITQSATNVTSGDQPRLASSRLTAETNGEGDHTDGNNQDDSPQHIDSEVI